MDAKKVEKLLLNHLSKRKDFLVLTTNLSWDLAFEADVFYITKDLKIFEYEIKVSKSDFNRDYKKSKLGVSKYDFLDCNKNITPHYDSKRPNKFYYVCPSGLINKNEIPSNYGLIHIMPSGQVATIKHSKTLHENKTTIDMSLKVARNFCLKKSRL